jgi:hypothetical protein
MLLMMTGLLLTAFGVSPNHISRHSPVTSRRSDTFRLFAAKFLSDLCG